jgi:hypothetical protein
MRRSELNHNNSYKQYFLLWNMNYEHSRPEDYMDRDGIQIVPKVLYAYEEGKGVNFFLFDERPSKIMDCWFATPLFSLPGGDQKFTTEETKRLKPVENPEEQAEWLREYAAFIDRYGC